MAAAATAAALALGLHQLAYWCHDLHKLHILHIFCIFSMCILCILNVLDTNLSAAFILTRCRVLAVHFGLPTSTPSPLLPCGWANEEGSNASAQLGDVSLRDGSTESDLPQGDA